MKDALRCIGLLVAGLLAATFLYPFLHEIGHIITAAGFGFKISNFQLLPLPSVVCEMDLTNKFATGIVGFGGMILPYFISLIPPKKHFWLWYIWLVISGICLLSFILSIVGVVLYSIEMPMNNEDITQVIAYSGRYYILYLVILIALVALRIIQIIRTKPIKRCLIEFGV